MQPKTNPRTDVIYNGNQKWSDHLPTIALIILFFIFFAYSVFIAINLQPNIIPDEPAHFQFSKHYASTWGIPPDVPETYSLGWYIHQNPFLYYWINGRIINIVELFFPDLTDWHLLITLRLVSAVYALGTAIFCFLLSKELIKHRWWRLLPVFLLTHTLMFVFLAGGVSYDNLANLLSIAAIFFWVRVLNHKHFINNSFGWMICVFTATLVKYPILPLALALGVAWFFYAIKNRRMIFPLKFDVNKDVILGVLLLVVIIGNLAIYGYNLVAYQTITPPCTQILTEAECKISPYFRRFQESALDEKLSINQAISLGFPDPLTYIIDSWIPNMFYRIFGILAHISYFPAGIIILFRLLLYWLIFLGVRYWRKPTYTHVSMMCVFAFYALVLLIINYNSELVYGFRQIAVQGRYIFPVIGIVYVLLSKILWHVPNKAIKYATLFFTVGLFIYGGPIKFLRYYDTVFSTWFIR